MGAVRTIWLDNETRLWFLRGEEPPRFLGDAGLEDVQVGRGIGATWECSYCGSSMPGDELKCSACNAPRKTRRRHATALLLGWLPCLMWFDAVGDGFTLEVHRGRCGNPMDYAAHTPVARLTNCQIVHKIIPRLCPLGGADIAPIEFQVYIEGDFSFTDPEHEDDQKGVRQWEL